MKKSEIARELKSRLIKGCENVKYPQNQIYLALYIAVSHWQNGADLENELIKLKKAAKSRAELALIKAVEEEARKMLCE